MYEPRHSEIHPVHYHDQNAIRFEAPCCVALRLLVDFPTSISLAATMAIKPIVGVSPPQMPTTLWALTSREAHAD